MLRLRVAAPFYGAVLILGVCATIFIPPLYKENLVDWLSLSGTATSFFFAILDAFAFFTLPAGKVIDRYGFTTAGIAAASLTLTGYALLYVTVEQRNAGGISAVLAFIAAAVCGQGSIFAVMVSLKVIAATVATSDRGKAIGLCMALFGLSGGFYTAIFKLCRTNEWQAWLFLFCGGSMAGLMFISSFLLRPIGDGISLPKADQRSGSMNLILLYCIIATMLVCSLSFTSGTLLMVVAGVLVSSLGILALMALVLGLILRVKANEVNASALGFPEDSGSSNTELSESVKLQIAMKEPRYWLLWYQFAVLVGAGIAMINLLANVVTSATPSLDLQEELKTGGTAWFSVGNVVSRFLLGYLSDILLSCLDRTSFMLMATAVMALAMLFVSALDASSHIIYLPCFLAGFAFGMPWILVPAIEIDWYGHKFFSSIHGVMMLAAVSGVLLFFNALSIVTKDDAQLNTYFWTWLFLAGFNACGLVGGIAARMRRVSADRSRLIQLEHS